MNAVSGAGSVSTSDRPQRSRCMAPGTCPAAKSSAGRRSRTSGLGVAAIAAERAAGVVSSWAFGNASMRKAYTDATLDRDVFTLQSRCVDAIRALDQIEEIHRQIAKGEVYRGYRSVPLALSGLMGLVAAGGRPAALGVIDPIGFVLYWTAIAAGAAFVGSSEIIYNY